MRVLWRVLLIVGTFAVVGYATTHILIARAVAHGTPEYNVRMGGALGGLFVGGGAATLVALIVLLGGKPRPHPPEEDPED